MGFIELEPCILLRVWQRQVGKMFALRTFKVERGHTKSYGEPTQIPKNKVEGEGRWTKNKMCAEGEGRWTKK